MKKKPLPPPATAPAKPAPAPETHGGTPRYGDFGQPAPAPPTASPVDHRAEGGNVFDLHNEQTTL